MTPKFSPELAAGHIEEVLVREVGERIGYGRTMQICEKIWNEKMPGAAHSTGPCVSMLVRCPCPVSGRDKDNHCTWCCGSGRITEKVRWAIRKLDSLARSAK